MRVAVIGGAGRMGRWLVKHFINQRHDVVLSDIRSDEAKAVSKLTGAKLALDNFEAVREADLTVVSTPIEATRKVLSEISPELKRFSAVMEISSLKSQVIPVLRDLAEQGVSTLSVHPLFGPGAQKLEKEKIVLVPVFNPSSELRQAKRFFPDAEIVVVEVEEHDRAMALTLSLTHFLNIVFGSVIGDEDINVLKKLGGTTFSLQLMLSEAVLAEDPDLYSSIQMSNAYADQYLEKLVSKAEILRKHITEKDSKSFARFYNDVRSSLSKDRDFANAYERMYKALEAL